METIYHYFLIFLIYAILGWCMEIINGFVRTRKFVNRGFLIGPYCPIYGVGAVTITLILTYLNRYPVILFFSAIILCGTIEYITSYVMEKIFKARWWDYKNRKYNLNGRICLETVIPFGILGCLIIYVFNPLFDKMICKLPSNTLKLISIVAFIIFISDFILSCFVMSKLRKTTKKVNIETAEDNTEEINKKVKEILKNSNPLDRRLMKAFPKVYIENIKKKIKENTQKAKEAATKVKEETTDKIKDIKENVSDKIKRNKKNK